MNYKIFISVDMEGITGVIHWDDTSGTNQDYQYFRKIMTQEANAAIEGAIEANATEIIVRDAHGGARNIFPDLLHEKAKLLREWSSGPFGMMEGIDESYSAVICIGYHAKANTPNGTLKHTMSGSILDLKVNEISLPELGWNGLIAGYFNVPIILVSGDQAICDQAKSLFHKIETVAVKQGIGKAAVNIHPTRSIQLIKDGVKSAMQNIPAYKPLKFESPYKIEIQFKDENKAYRAAWYPTAVRNSDLGVAFTGGDFMDCLRFFMFVT